MKRHSSFVAVYRPIRGFTLVELLVVLLIVGIVAAVALPVVIPAISHRQVGDSARIIQGGLVAARDAALRTNSPHGIRFLPDPTFNGVDPAAPTSIDSNKILASNRFIAIEQPPAYSEGKLITRPGIGVADVAAQFDNAPWLIPPSGGFAGINTSTLLPSGRILFVVQAKYRTEYVFDSVSGTMRPTYPLETPTSWYWNIRVGDRIQINDVGPFFTVVGPMDVDNPEKFVNVDPEKPAFRLTHPDASNSTPFYPEILFLVDGQDGDRDGYIDNGRDGLDNNQDGYVDDLLEWSETESWGPVFSTFNPQTNGQYKKGGGGEDGVSTGVPYSIIRQPVPSPGSRETLLPGNVVVDLTTTFSGTRERSRLPVDPLSGRVDILVEPSGRVVPTTQYSSPASFAMDSSFYHIWVAERSDLAEVPPPNADGNRVLAAPYTFALPMPLNVYPATLLTANPSLPSLKGEMRLLSVSTRTGNIITTDRPSFSVSDLNLPYRAAQLGAQGDTP